MKNEFVRDAEEAAAAFMQWAAQNDFDPREPGKFTGGVVGFLTGRMVLAYEKAKELDREIRERETPSFRDQLALKMLPFFLDAFAFKGHSYTYIDVASRVYSMADALMEARSRER
jgi:hypothetical protein